MLWNRNKLFCDINPTCYAISEQKEICKRHLKNFLGREKRPKTILEERLPHVICGRSINLIKTGDTIDPVLQENKAVNINLACSKISGMVIRPGEEFSFWVSIGRISKKKGYKDGRVLIRKKLQSSIGGGLCNLGNTINWLVLHSPLDVTEFHSHSDALDPDRGARIPLNSGTSVSYNYIDYRFKNNTAQDIQLLLWCDDTQLHGELRSRQAFPHAFEIVEEDHRFQEENGKYYRVSNIYKNTIEKATGAVIDKKLFWANHSEVMYDPALIPKELIRC